MAKTKVNKRKTKKTVNPKKSASGLMKILEIVVLVGTVAGVLIKLFRGNKTKK